MVSPRWLIQNEMTSTKTSSLSKALGHACERKDVSEVESLLRSGANVNAAKSMLNDVLVPALMVSVHHGSADCAELLINAKARLNGQFGPSMEAALHVCCSRGSAEVAKVLIEAGAQVDLADYLGRTPLFLSCLAVKPALCALMLAAGADTDKAMTKRNPGAVPLYAAALKGAAPCVQLLCEASANVNARTSDGATPMLVACQEGRFESAMILSSYGAHRETVFMRCLVPGTSTNWAEELARRHGHFELQLWLKRSVRFTPLCHVQVLTPQRTRSILRTGSCSPDDGAAEIARELLELGPQSLYSANPEHPSYEAAWLILRAAAPWSPETHSLWGAPHRARAVQVLKIGYLLAVQYAHDAGHGSFLDVWVAHLMPQAITWHYVPSRHAGFRLSLPSPPMPIPCPSLPPIHIDHQLTY